MILVMNVNTLVSLVSFAMSCLSWVLLYKYADDTLQPKAVVYRRHICKVTLGCSVIRL